MKRNNETIKTEKFKKNTRGTSKYATKVARGHQMYGPGCCAHTFRVKQRKDRERDDPTVDPSLLHALRVRPEESICG